MNATRELAAGLDRPALRRLASALRLGSARAATERLRGRVVDAFALDLAGFLNSLQRHELDAVAAAAEVDSSGSIGELRARLWMAGASMEVAGEVLGAPLQPVPVVLRGKLVVLSAAPALAPPTDLVPRPVPPPRPAAPPAREPDTLDELLAAADDLLGVRLGADVADKGAFGTRIAELLGVPERGVAEPDWRGEVEIKTVPVVRDRAGWWRVKEDPAIAMEGIRPRSKLVRVLWIARVADAADSPVLCWFYQERGHELDPLIDRDLHTRPKGGAGATTRGWYLHKRFFTDNGLLRALNGS